MRSVVATLCLLAAAVVPARAEVGVSTGGGSGTGNSLTNAYILGIIEDPEPTPLVWRVFRAINDGSFHILNPDGEANGDGPPSVLVDPAAGTILVAWSRNSATGFDVVVSRFEEDAWTAPEVVAGGSANALDPDLVLAPDGSVHLFYWVDDGATRTVMRSVAPPDLSSWSAPQGVSQPGESACRPSATFHQGVLRVAYEVHDFGFGGTPRQVVLAREEAGGFVREVVAVTNNSAAVRPQVHSHAGTMWVDWVDALSGSSGEMGWTRTSPGGSWDPIHYEPFGSAEELQYLVRGAIRLQAIQ